MVLIKYYGGLIMAYQYLFKIDLLKFNEEVVMKSIKIVLSLLLILMGYQAMQAEAGQYDLRFVQIESTQSGIVLVDIEIKAHTEDREFYLADQNYRFSFNETAVLPYTNDAPSVNVNEELNISGLIGQTYYDNHHLNGSVENIISYNVELLSGEGVYISADTWVKVGQVAFTLISPDVELELTWHKIADFPTTYIAEKKDNNLSRLDEGNYYDLTSTPLDNNDLAAEEMAFEIFPNPVSLNNPFQVKINKMAGKAELVFANGVGQVISSQSINLTGSEQMIEVQTSRLPAGIYWLSLQTNDSKFETQPVFIKK